MGYFCNIQGVAIIELQAMVAAKQKPHIVLGVGEHQKIIQNTGNQRSQAST